jgi:alcohol dehydrogenase/L-iditol 2-dehydrogenase
MKAVALTAPGCGHSEVRVVEDWPEPECGADDVLVRVRAVGLCGTDLARP